MHLPSRALPTSFRMGWVCLQRYLPFSTASRGHLRYFFRARKIELVSLVKTVSFHSCSLTNKIYQWTDSGLSRRSGTWRTEDKIKESKLSADVKEWNFLVPVCPVVRRMLYFDKEGFVFQFMKYRTCVGCDQNASLVISSLVVLTDLMNRLFAQQKTRTGIWR